MIEKVLAEQLFQYCKSYYKLHLKQMGSQKKRSAIDVVAILVYIVQERYEEKKLATVLFMDVKSVFDYVSKAQLVTQMIALEIGRDLILWISSFLTDQKVQLVIDGHKNREREKETRIPQGSLVSLTLFLIYISGVFDQLTKTCPFIICL